MKTNYKTFFYTDKPIFGLDIGFSSLKVMQISAGKRKAISGYGVTDFDSSVIKDGIIINPESLAKSVYELFSKHIVGEITTNRVAVTVPVAKTFTRTITVPRLSAKELNEAVRTEAEQYTPVPIDNLYMDYSVVKKTDKEMELLIMAIPKKIIDSYMDFVTLIGLEPVAFETTIGAGARLFVHAEQSDVPTVLMDFGSISTDITIYDKGLVVTGTVPGGGDTFTDRIAQQLNISKQQAHTIKTEYGLSMSKKQAAIMGALEPDLASLLKEVRRILRYYEERSGGKNSIKQIVSMGGGANMPGLSEYMTNKLRLPVRMCDPWHKLSFNGLQPPNITEKSMYVTVTGLALINSKEVFAK